MWSILVAAVAVAADQFTKWLVLTRMAELTEIPIIPGFFSLQHVHNPGAAFGMLQNQRWFFVAAALLAVAAILWYLRLPETQHWRTRLSLGLIMGGALGNLIDRVRGDGEVTDFLLFYWRDYYFPNFNVADICITVGVGLFLLHMLLTERKSKA